MTNVFDQIRMLPREVPRDPFHEQIVQALVDGPADQRTVMPLFDMPGVGFHRALYTLTLFLAEYRTQGRQTFVVPAQMQDALARTSLKDIGFNELKLPYRCLYMALPDCEAQIWGGEQTLWHKVGGVFVRHVPPGEAIQDVEGETTCPEGMINVYIWGMENERSHGPGDDASMWFTFDLAEMRNTDLETYLLAMLNDPERDASLTEMTEFGRSLGLSTQMPRNDGGVAIAGVLHVMRVLFNALLYMDCQDAEVTLDEAVVEADFRRKEITTALGRMKNPNKSRGRKLRKQLASLPTDIVSWVGRSVRIRGNEPATSTGTGTPQREHWVRGHWWPRRDTIAHRIREATQAHDKAQEEANSARKRLANLSEDDPEITTLVPIVAALRRAEAHHRAEKQTITEQLALKRRWVKPYKKGSRGSVPDSHTYVLGTPAETSKESA